jgi:hypothetical protein
MKRPMGQNNYLPWVDPVAAELKLSLKKKKKLNDLKAKVWAVAFSMSNSKKKNSREDSV